MSKVPAAAGPRTTRTAKWLILFSCLNLALVCGLSYLLYGISETWWLGVVATYAPRAPFLAPSLALLLCSLFWHRESFGINLVSLSIVAVPIMGLSIPLDLWMNGPQKTPGELPLKILSCNVQAFEPDFARVLEEIANINPDVVALQEARHSDGRLEEYFHDWHTVDRGGYWIGSRYPVTFLTDIDVTQFGGRKAGMIVKITTPAGPVILADVHQMTARWGLKELTRYSLIDGRGINELEAYEHDRYLESMDIRDIINTARQDLPLVVCGDFNTPTSSSLFQRHWGDLRSAYDVASFGYGYTSPCKSNRFWPSNFPWARIDHILCSNEWSVRRCEIGVTDGSDHRLIAAKVALRPSAPVVSQSEVSEGLR